MCVCYIYVTIMTREEEIMKLRSGGNLWEELGTRKCGIERM